MSKLTALNTFPLSFPRKTKAELRIFGDVSMEDIERLKKQFDFFLLSAFDWEPEKND